MSRFTRLALALTIASTLAGCATSQALHNGRKAEDRLDYDTAVIEYGRALQLDPDSTNARTGLQRAKLRASQDHFSRARRWEPRVRGIRTGDARR